jgi:hypothetical protein
MEIESEETLKKSRENDQSERKTLSHLKDEALVMKQQIRGDIETISGSVYKSILKSEWILCIDSTLTDLIEKHTGKLDREGLIKMRAVLDLHWSDSKTLKRIGLIASNDYEFWTDLSKENLEMKLIGSIAAALVSCPTSEAQCERGFSFLHYVLRRERNRLSLQKLFENLIIKTSSPLPTSSTSSD